MATNADQDDTNVSTVTDDDNQVTEDDLRDLKYGSKEVETSDEADETEETNESEESEEAGEEDGQTDDQTEDEEEQSESEYVKEFPNIKGETLEDYTKGLEEAYKNSTAEAMRLKKLVDESQSDTKEESSDIDTSNPTSLYMKQKMDQEIQEAFNDFSKTYPQVADQVEYNKFTQEVSTLSQTILSSQKRLASPKELYTKAAVILGWEPDNKVDNKEKLGIALKGTAAVSKTSSSTKSKGKQSKVGDAEVMLFKKLNPQSDKTDAQIREELEPFN